MNKSTATLISAKVVVMGIHHWPSAPQHEPLVAFLANPHNHNFIITAKKQVFHDDRDIELILFAEKVKKQLRSLFNCPDDQLIIDFGANSCESIAHQLLTSLDLQYCSVFEDEFLGAEVFSCTHPLNYI